MLFLLCVFAIVAMCSFSRSVIFSQNVHLESDECVSATIFVLCRFRTPLSGVCKASYGLRCFCLIVEVLEIELPGVVGRRATKEVQVTNATHNTTYTRRWCRYTHPDGTRKQTTNCHIPPNDNVSHIVRFDSLSFTPNTHTVTNT